MTWVTHHYLFIFYASNYDNDNNNYNDNNDNNSILNAFGVSFSVAVKNLPCKMKLQMHIILFIGTLHPPGALFLTRFHWDYNIDKKNHIRCHMWNGITYPCPNAHMLDCNRRSNHPCPNAGEVNWSLVNTMGIGHQWSISLNSQTQGYCCLAGTRSRGSVQVFPEYSGISIGKTLFDCALLYLTRLPIKNNRMRWLIRNFKNNMNISIALVIARWLALILFQF